MNEVMLGQPSISSSILAFWGPKEENPQSEAKDLLQRIFIQNCPKRVQTNPFATFWGLRKKAWMQFVDGRFHEHGSEVFDKGLHAGVKEPGYLKSIFNAGLFASKNIGKLLTTQFYKEIHKVACGHFDGVSTHLKAEKTGQFDPTCSHFFGFFGDLFPEMTKEEIDRYEELSEIEKKGTGFEEADEATKKYGLDVLGYKDEESFLRDQKLARSELDSLWSKTKNKMNLINEEIAQRSAQLGFDPVAKLVFDSDDFPWQIKVVYACNEVEEAVEKLFARYSEEMLVATEPDKKIEWIADLYQMLEWIHPFRDGQGRTDLVLLSTLLSKHGLNPPILKFPYYSTFSLKKEWTEYLSNGVQEWKKVKTN